MRHAARRPVAHVRSRVPQLLVLGAGLAALGLAVLMSVTGVPGGLDLSGDDPEPRLASEEQTTTPVAEPQPATADPVPVRAPPRGGAGGPRAERWAAALLDEWDRARERSWQAADAAALRALYVPGSSAAERDVELLARWSAAGLEVRSLRLRVDALQVVALSPHRAVLEVTDRLRVRATAGAGGAPLRLGRDRPSTRVVALVRDTGAWRVARVEPAGTA